MEIFHFPILQHCIWIVQIGRREKCSFVELPAIWFLSADCVELAGISAVVLLLSAIAADKNWTKSTSKCSVLLLTRYFLIDFILPVFCTLQSTQSAVHDHSGQIKSETRFDFLHLFGFTFYSWRWSAVLNESLVSFKLFLLLCRLESFEVGKRKFELIEFSFVSCFIT